MDPKSKPTKKTDKYPCMRAITLEANTVEWLVLKSVEPFHLEASAFFHHFTYREPYVV